MLPFLGPLSEKCQRRLKKIFQTYIPVGKINLVFKTQRRLSNILKFKDVVPSDFDSHIIYHFQCPRCNAGYIGETRVHHKVRNSQHLGISEYTGKHTTSGEPTSVTKHILAEDHSCSLSDFSIIGKEQDYHKRLMKESLFIKKYDYALNKHQTSIELNLF